MTITHTADRYQGCGNCHHTIDTDRGTHVATGMFSCADAAGVPIWTESARAYAQPAGDSDATLYTPDELEAEITRALNDADMVDEDEASDREDEARRQGYRRAVADMRSGLDQLQPPL